MLIGAVSATGDADVVGNGTGEGEGQNIELPATKVIESGDDNNQNDETPVADEKDSSENQVLSNKTANFEVSKDTNYLNKSTFSVKLVDENGTGIVNKSVAFKLNGVTSNSTTDDGGIAKLILSVHKAGTYTVTYSFEDDGYTSVKSSSQLLVLTTGASKIKGSNYVAYYGAKNTYVLTLTADNVPLANRKVSITIHGVTYTKSTNSKGQASFAIGLVKGKYPVNFTFAGEKNIKKSSGKATITVKKGMPTKIVKANSVTYKNKVSAPFEIKLKDTRGNALANKYVKFTINKKTYKVKTNSKGIAKINIKLKAGSYKLKVAFAKTSVYNAASKTYTVKVKTNIKNGGIWLFAYDMNKVSFKSMKKYGINQIFLNYYAITKHGQSYVEKYIQSASKYSIKVHIWMQVFYNGKWQNPTKKGKINYDLINKKVKEAKKYAKVKGVAGVHFDYLRFPGTAYKYKNAVNAVNYFTKKASNAIHKINSKLIVSAAVMPEPSGNKYYYGQDIPTLSKYLDVIVPMVYKGNYNAGTKWIKSVTQTLVKQSKGAKIWTGLQSYKSDSDVSRLSASALKKDTLASVQGGATGIVFFRYGLTNFFKLSNL